MRVLRSPSPGLTAGSDCASRQTTGAGRATTAEEVVMTVTWGNVMSGQGVEVETLLTVITGPGETPASVHAEVNAGTVLTAGPLTDLPEVPVLQTGSSLQLTGVPEQSTPISSSPHLSLISPVSFPVRAADLTPPGPGTVPAPLGRAGEPLAVH